MKLGRLNHIGVPNHFIRRLNMREQLIRQVEIVPIEVVAIAGRQVAALDMPRAEFDSAPVWDAAKSTPLAPDDSIRIALYKR